MGSSEKSYQREEREQLVDALCAPIIAPRPMLFSLFSLFLLFSLISPLTWQNRDDIVRWFNREE